MEFYFVDFYWIYILSLFSFSSVKVQFNFSREEIFWGDYFTFAVELNT